VGGDGLPGAVVVQVSPANRAECQQRIRIAALGQRLVRALPELDTRLQRDLDDGSESRLGSADDIGSSKGPRSVDNPDQALPPNEISSCV
jgi:hypothetical protein